MAALQNFIEDQPREFRMETSHLAVSEITGPSLLKAIKCLVSPIKSNRRLSTKSKVEISGTGEVGLYRFFMLTIICCVDESHRGEPRNGQ
jgi:hypothetical protein